MQPVTASTVIIHLSALLLLMLAACGGGSGGGAGGAAASLTRIEGRVNDVAPAVLATSDTTVARTNTAGVQVSARAGTQVLAVTTTDTEGRFTLEFAGGGDIELAFSIADAVLTVALNLLPGSVVSLVVELRLVERRVVVVEETVADSRPLRCETGNVRIVDEDLDLLIDGRGRDCVRTAGNCRINLAVRSLTLVGCDRCIDARGTSDISIASDSFVCASREDGIRAVGTSRVSVDALDGLEIVSGDGHGVRAEGTARVSLASSGLCRIDGDDGAVRERGAAAVNLGGCAAVDLRGDFDDDD